MEKARYLRIYDLHSWTGAVLGLLIFAVSFTGCIALFHQEILTWEDPAKRLAIGEELTPIDATFKAWVKKEAGDNEIEFLRFNFPSDYEPYYSAMLQYHDENDEHVNVKRRWNATTGETLPHRGEGLSTWLLNFHRDLMWPDELGGRQIGRSLVGIVGIIAILSIISGVLAHKKLFKEMFTLRYMRSTRLKWQDTHNILGIWGFPFSLMISFTGAFLGVVALLAPVVAFLAFKGDQETLIEAVLGAPAEPTGVISEMYSVDRVFEIKEPDSGYDPGWIIAINWGDETATYDVYYNADTELRAVDGIKVNGVDGTIMPSQFEDLSAPNHVINAMSPLHYGTYGGIALKYLYFVLGLMMTVMAGLGLMMWVERRLYGGAGENNPQKYQRYSNLFTGGMMGLPVASAALFYHDKLYAGAEDARIVWTGLTYFLIWLAGTLYPFFRGNNYKSTKDLMMFTAFLTLGIPFLNAATTGGSLSGPVTSATYVDLTCLVLGALTLLVAYRLPTERKSRSRKGAQQNIVPEAAE